MWEKFNWKKIGLFAGGVLFGSLGIKALASKDAKKCYTQVTAAALRVKDYALKQTAIFKENCEDIYEDAKDINEERACKEEASSYDTSETDFNEVEKTEE